MKPADIQIIDESISQFQPGRPGVANRAVESGSCGTSCGSASGNSCGSASGSSCGGINAKQEILVLRIS